MTDKGSASRKAITVECFGGHLSMHKIDAALDELVSITPAPIEVETVPTTGRATKIYRLMRANKANVTKDQQRRSIPPDSHVGELCEPREENHLAAIDPESLGRNVRSEQEQAETRMDIDPSPSSPAQMKTGVHQRPATADVEEF